MTEELRSVRRGTDLTDRRITMCVAAPGKIIDIKDNIATIDYNGNTVTANAGVVDVKVGDRVLVHAGLIIQKISESEAEEMAELFSMLEELGNA